ncbi:hypothetical protein EK546_24380, partial [Salmonella enterica]|nr:hypothetical protein [Salmonella enterica]EBB5972564.1 hypothetical protein [Salmonella enterica]
MYRFFPPTQQKAYKKLNLLNFYFKKYIILFASAYNIALPEHLNAFGKLKSRENPVFRSQKGKIFMFFFKTLIKYLKSSQNEVLAMLARYIVIAIYGLDTFFGKDVI